MIRHEDWPERLLDFVDSRRSVPFQWGVNDCCTFAADAVLEMTGEDPMAAIRGAYDSALSAAALAERIGGIESFLDGRMPSVVPAMARRGDLVMFDAEEGPALGVVLGTQAAAAGPDGVTWVPLGSWRLAWRVGGAV